MQPQGQRICKYGNKCNRFAQGTCTFFHPSNSQSMGGQQDIGGQGNDGGYRDQGGQRGRGGWRKPGAFDQHLYGGQQGGYTGQQTDFKQQGGFQNQQEGYQGRQGSYQGQQGGFQGQQGQQGGFQGQQSQGPRGGPNDRNSDATFNNFCRDYHFGNQCKFKEKCFKKHQFIINSQDRIKRLNFMRTIPSDFQSKLTKFTTGGQDYLVLRHGMKVNIFSFNPETKGFLDVYEWKFPQGGNYHYYDHKDLNLYYSLQNVNTSYEDIGFFNVQELKNYYIPNSHHGRVIGMGHFSDTVMLSASKLGQLKVWTKDPNNPTYLAHTQSQERLKRQINPNNIKTLQFLFLDISQINGMKIISIGTNDGRLLLFIGNELKFIPITFSQLYSTVFQVRYTYDKEVPIALVLTWNQAQTLSAILSINLITFEIKPLLQINTTTDQPNVNINLFELFDDLLFVCNVGGQVSIYAFPDMTQKIGGIWHQNTVINIVPSIGQIKSTNLKMKLVFVLQRKTEKREGSLGIYLIK